MGHPPALRRVSDALDGGQYSSDVGERREAEFTVAAMQCFDEARPVVVGQRGLGCMYCAGCYGVCTLAGCIMRGLYVCVVDCVTLRRRLCRYARGSEARGVVCVHVGKGSQYNRTPRQ